MLVLTTDMSLARQLFEILLAGAIAGASTFAVSLVSPRYGLIVGVVLACMYYFSRYPWGSERGYEYNQRIDDLFDEYLPF